MEDWAKFGRYLMKIRSDVLTNAGSEIWYTNCGRGAHSIS